MLHAASYTTSARGSGSGAAAGAKVQLEVVLRLGLLLDKGGHTPGVVDELAVRAPPRTLFVVDDCIEWIETRMSVNAVHSMCTSYAHNMSLTVAAHRLQELRVFASFWA